MFNEKMTSIVGRSRKMYRAGLEIKINQAEVTDFMQKNRDLRLQVKNLISDQAEAARTRT